MDRLHLIRRAVRFATIVAALTAMATTGFLTLTGRRPLVERTGSMAPVLTAGDVLVVERRSASELVPGDIVTFAHPARPGATLTHRVTAVRAVRRDRLQVTTRGDANPAGETWTIPLHGEVGVLDGFVPLPAGAVRLLDRTPVRGIAMALLCACGLGVTLRAIWRREPRCVAAS